MIVRLSHHQGRAVAHRVSTLHRKAMLEHRQVRGRTQHDYDLPAIAWTQILAELTDTCFGPAGGKLDRGVPKSAYGAIKRISEALMRVERHPALREAAVEGWVGDLIPCWQIGDRWSHLPDADRVPRGFWVMTPMHLVLHQMNITAWRPGRVVVGSWTLREESHLEFVGRSAAPDGELLADQFEFEDFVRRHPLGGGDRRRVDDEGLTAAEQE